MNKQKYNEIKTKVVKFLNEKYDNPLQELMLDPEDTTESTYDYLMDEYPDLDDEEDNYALASYLNDDISNDNKQEVTEPDNSRTIAKERMNTLLGVLRSELKKPFNDRGELDFKLNGKTYTGIPMVEISSTKFNFKIGDKYRNVDIYKITIL